MRRSKRLAGLAVGAAAALVTAGLAAGATPASAATGNWPAGAVYTTDLIAGQHYDAGDVAASYTGSTLTITITPASGWCVTAAHAAAGPVAAIPKTKSGNPVPGQFASRFADPTCRTTAFAMPAITTGGTWDKTFAVQADVWKMSDTTSAYVVSNATNVASKGTTTVVGHYYPGTTNSLDADCTPANALWIWYTGVFSNPPDGTPDAVTFTKTFTPGGPPVPGSGSLQITADDTYAAGLNGTAVGSDALWSTCETYNGLTPVPGTNTLSIVATNVYTADPFWGADGNNIAGLLYRFDYSYYSHQEGAWSAGTAFPSASNWSTFSTFPSVTSVALTNGWDSFGAGTGTVQYAVEHGRLFLYYSLSGAGQHTGWIAGAHFFTNPAGLTDPAVGPGDAHAFGAGSFVGDGFPVTRDANTFWTTAIDFGSFSTDVTGAGSETFTLMPNVDTYYLQFTVRTGPVCAPPSDTSGCGVAFRTGAPFGGTLIPLTIS